MLMLLRHLGFVHGPIREHCPASLKCMDTLVEKAIAQKAHRLVLSFVSYVTIIFCYKICN